MEDIQAWRVEGDWFDVCSCNVPCPCSWAEPPDDGHCEGVLVWRIRSGRFGDVKLDGLNVMAVGTFSGNIWDGTHSEPKMGVLIDERADERQREALLKIFGGQAGGWPGRFMEIFGAEMVGLDFAPITVEIDPDLASWKAEVTGRISAAARGLTGPTSVGGRPPTVTNLPGAETGPGQTATWGKATTDCVDAFSFNWEHQGKSSKHITFDWSGPDQV